MTGARTVQCAPGPLAGSVFVPGDKSISHRVVLFAAMAEGTSHLARILDSADVRSTTSAVRALGAGVVARERPDGGLDLDVAGWGTLGPAPPLHEIDCGNSGTTVRLLLGVLASWPQRSYTLTGDESVSKRPMARVTEPLSRMGATFETAEGGLLPVTVHGGRLHGVSRQLNVASAQVKTALLLAGVRAEGRTLVAEPAPSRDHTERLLPGFGVPVGRDESRHACWVDGPARLSPTSLAVPGDPSSAAFLVAAAALVPRSKVTVCEVALNPTRAGFLGVLERMGADVSVHPHSVGGVEPVGDLMVRHASLHSTVVAPAEVPSLIDEVPVLAVVASQAKGTTRFSGVGELRVKESDRLEGLAEGLAALGVQVRSGEDWLEVDGPVALRGGAVDSLGDHRLAMAFAVAALVATKPVTIERYDAIDVSFPGFTESLRTLLA